MLHLLRGRDLPGFSTIIERLNNPTPAAIAAALGVHAATVRRWIAADRAPLPAMFALHLVTEGGQHNLGAELRYLLDIHAAHMRAADDEIARLKRELARVLALGDSGAANLPVYRAETAAELLARPARRFSPSP